MMSVGWRGNMDERMGWGETWMSRGERGTFENRSKGTMVECERKEGYIDVSF